MVGARQNTSVVLAWKPEVAMLPKTAGLKMVAANGTVIDNVGAKLIRFQGFTGRA